MLCAYNGSRYPPRPIEGSPLKLACPCGVVDCLKEDRRPIAV
jgi:hypothetical protein